MCTLRGLLNFVVVTVVVWLPYSVNAFFSK